MGDINTDNQDSETSTTSSWILLGDEEAKHDLANEDNKELFFNNVFQHLNNNTTDVESDGISIISESEYSLSGSKSDEDSIFLSEDDKFGTKEEILEKEYCYKQNLFHNPNVEDCCGLEEEPQIIKSQNKEKEVIEDKNPKCRCIEIIGQNEDIGENKSVTKTSGIFAHLVKILNSSFIQLTETLTTYCTLKEILWSLILCFSIGTIYIFIFPLFSSREENGEVLKKSNSKQFDIYLLSDTNSLKDNAFSYCRQTDKNELYQCDSMKTCIKDLGKDEKVENKKLREGKIDWPSDFFYDSPLNEFIQPISWNEWIKEQEQYSKSVKLKPAPFKSTKKSSSEGIQHPKLKKQRSNKKHRYNTNHFINPTRYRRYQKGNYVDESDLNEWQRKLNRKEELLHEKEKSLHALEKKLKRREKFILKRESECNTYSKLHAMKSKSKGSNKQKNRISLDVSKKWKIKKHKEGKHHSPSLNTFLNDEIISNEDKKINVNEYIDLNNLQFNKGYMSVFSKNKSSKLKFKIQNSELDNHMKSVVELGVEGGKNYKNLIYLKLLNTSKCNVTNSLDDNHVPTGEWYLNLLHSRQEIREKEQKAVWWFDRAVFRKNKRNKAHWYFQYMFNRENLRYNNI